MIRRVLAIVAIVVVAVALAVAAWPQLLGLERLVVITQVVSFRTASVAVATIGIVLLLIVALLSRTARRFAASVAFVFLAFVVVEVVVQAGRGFGDNSFEAATDSDVTVLSWNTLGDAPGAQVVADLALAQKADVVTLPETTESFGTAVASLMGDAGRPMQAFTEHYDEISKARSTTLLVSEALGAYAVDRTVGSTAQLPSVVARPVDGDGPTLLAVHPVAPVTGELTTWSSDLDWLAATCVGDDVIMAGDFNSTLDHYAHLPHARGAAIGDCVDAAKASGNAAVGTWPTSVPALAGTPIDHVMATPNWRVAGMGVIQSEDSAGSDHRPIVARLAPAEGSS